jgi:hypothetical protein
MNGTTAIANRTEAPPTRWSEPALPSKVSALLDQNSRFADMPIIGPVTAGQLRAYVESCRPPMPTAEQVNSMVTRLANMMPSPRLSDDADEADRMAVERMATYRRALASHALPDLHAAFDQILRKCRFFPTIAEMEAIIAPIRAKRTARASRAQSLIMKHEREWSPPAANVVSIEEVAQLRQESRDALAAAARAD